MLRPRRPSLLSLVPFAAASFALLTAVPARADDLTLVTRELGGWNEALEALRADLGSEGRRLHIGVRSGTEPVSCDRYRLELDAAAAAAFRIGGCDPGTQETLLVLAHRGALFDDGFHVPRPRTLSLSAVLRTTAVGGGGPQGGSVVRCSWAVRPYLDDLKHGTRVMLTPEHYALRSATASVSATPDRTGWNLSVSGSAVFQLEYEVTDLASGDVVLRQKTTLTCADTAASEEPRPLPPGGEVVVHYTPPPSSSSWAASPALPGPGPCLWGQGRKGCYGSPLGPAVALTIVGAAASAGGGALCYAGSRAPGTKNDNFMIPGILTTVVGVVASAAGAYHWYELAHPPGLARVQPAITVSSQGGGLGLSGTF